MLVETSVKLVLPSEIRLIDLVHEAAESFARLAGLTEEEALNVGLAVREAVINSMVHGNRRDIRLEVGVTLGLERGSLVARITDQGQGFDPTRTPDPTAEANRLSDSGRGLLLMRAFVDEVSFRSLPQGGAEATLIKHLPAGRIRQ